mmetsp:Transcript_24515/g.45047  ORF Transcript_24515/g.45047 Transcript_24515/m.45047 type:complete len:196 (+) Transcript_24515:1-588(+)
MSCASVPLRLLDVGSNNNYLGRNRSRFASLFHVTAMDIAPAHESVVQADFLSVLVEEDAEVDVTQSRGAGEGAVRTTLRAGSFDVVLFSLLLSYLPTTRMRYQSCKQAKRLLKPNGLFLVFDPDSNCHLKSVQWMKDWKAAIEGLGFKRWRYRKAAHMHCMAFRAIDTALEGNRDGDHVLMHIPQDRLSGSEAVG